MLYSPVRTEISISAYDSGLMIGYPRLRRSGKSKVRMGAPKWRGNFNSAPSDRGGGTREDDGR
jgi:hypothetical protein